MTPKQQKFVEEYQKDLNATKAAQRAGYSTKTAYSAGQRLLKVVEVADALKAATEARSERADVTADRVLRELAVIAFSDIRALFGKNGQLKDIAELPEAVARMLASVEVTKQKTKRSGKSTTEEWVNKVKSWDKLKALELIGRHLKMWDEGDAGKKVPVDVRVTFGGRYRPESVVDAGR